MSSINISQNSLLSSMPPVHTSSITLEMGKVVVECSIKRYVKSDVPTEILKEIKDSLSGLSVKAMLSFDADKTSNIMRHINRNEAGRRIVGIVQPVIEKKFSALPPKLNSIDILSKTVDSNGRAFYDIPLSFSFEDSRIASDNLAHMACIVFTYSQPETEANSNLDPYSIMGKINTDIIIDNSNLVMENYGLKTPSGYMWLGDFHRGPQGLMSGRNRTNRSVTLTEVKVPNTKIRDYRIFQKMNTQPLVNEPKKMEYSNTAQFSNLFISTDQHKNVRGLFGIDCRQVYLNNVKFTNFIQDPDIFAKVMPYIKIRSIKLFRVRSDNDLFDEKLIAHTLDPTAPERTDLGGVFSAGKSNLLSDTLEEKEETIGSISEVYLDYNTVRGDTPNQIRYISFVDNAISNFTSGRYQYRVEIEFDDGTEKYFRRAQRQLKITLKNMQLYLQSINRLSSNKNGKLIQQFSTFDIRKKERTIGKSIAVYVENLSLTNRITARKKRELVRTLINMTHPMYSDENTLSSFVELIQKQVFENELLLTKSNRLAGTRDGKKDYASSLNHVGANRGIFLVSKEYSRKEEQHVLDCFNNTGLAYLYEPTAEIAELGLPAISVTDWRQRVAQEAQKYPGSDVSSNISGLENDFYFDSENNKNSYLSPVSARAGKNVIDLNEKNEQSVFAGFNALLYSRNEVRKISNIDEGSYDKVIDTEEKALKQIEDYGNIKSITVLPSTETEALVSSKRTLVEENEDQRAKKYVGGTSLFDDTEKDNEKFISETISKKPTRKKEVATAAAVLSQVLPKLSSNIDQLDNQSRTLSQEKGAIETSNERLNIKNPNNLVDKLPAGKLSAIPNQIMSAVKTVPNVFKSKNSGEFVRDYTNDSEFNVRFNSLQEIEILTGYGVSVTDMRFSTLNESSLEAIRGATLARMIPYKNSDLGIENKLNCPAFNRYFILGDPNLMTPDEGPTMKTILNMKITSHPAEFYNSSPPLKKSITTNSFQMYRPVRQGREQAIRDNLYTSGGEFMLPNGQEYVGYYHIHPTEGAMEGRTHTPTPHASLTPMRTQPLRQTTSQPAARRTQTTRTRPTTGGSGGMTGGTGGMTGGTGGGSTGY